MYTAFFVFQSFSKMYLYKLKKIEAKAKDRPIPTFPEIKYYNNKDALAMLGDRVMGNTLEQGVVFLPLLWMHATFVDPSMSFSLAQYYVVARVLYPILYFYYYPGVKDKKGRTSYGFVFSTFPAYAVNSYMMAKLYFALP